MKEALQAARALDDELGVAYQEIDRLKEIIGERDELIRELVAAAVNAGEWIRNNSDADDWPFCLDTLLNRIDKAREAVK